MKKRSAILPILGLLFLTNHMLISKKPSKGSTMSSTDALKTGSVLDTDKYTTTSHGIKHNIIKHGNGSKPLRGETVEVHYTGWLINPETNTLGALFDSSHSRNQTFKFPLGLGYVIKGWDLMVADMSIGEKRIVILPADVAYGRNGAGNVIPPNATLVFEIELFSSK